MFCDDLEGWDWGCGGREAQEGGGYTLTHRHTHKADLQHCTAETNTALQSNDVPIKKSK